MFSATSHPEVIVTSQKAAFKHLTLSFFERGWEEIGLWPIPFPVSVFLLAFTIKLRDALQ